MFAHNILACTATSNFGHGPVNAVLVHTTAQSYSSRTLQQHHRCRHSNTAMEVLSWRTSSTHDILSFVHLASYAVFLSLHHPVKFMSQSACIIENLGSSGAVNLIALTPETGIGIPNSDVAILIQPYEPCSIQHAQKFGNYTVFHYYAQAGCIKRDPFKQQYSQENNTLAMHMNIQ